MSEDKRTFLNKTMLIAGGTISGQAIYVALSIYLTKIYSSQDFGQLASFFSFYAPFLVVSSLKLDLALATAKDSEDAFKIYENGLLSVILIAILSLFFLLGIMALGYSANFNPTMFVAGAIFGGVLQITTVLRLVQGHQGAVSIAKIILGGLPGLFAIFFNSIGIHDNALVLSQILALLAAGFFLVLFPETCLKLPTFNQSIFQRYSKMISYGVSASLINSIALNIPIFFLAQHSVSLAGVYFLAQRIFAGPLSLISISIAQTFIGEFAKLESHKDNQIEKLFLNVSKNLAILGVLVLLVVNILPNRFYLLLFGSNWSDIGHIVKLLSFSIVLQFIVTPFSQVLNLTGRNRLQFFWDFSRLICVAASLYLPFLFGYDALASIMAFNLAMSAFYILLWILIFFSFKGIR